MKKITEEEAVFYQPLSFEDPLMCKKAVAYTATVMNDLPPVSLYGTLWENITYYADPNANYSVSPLEIMLSEWNTHKSDLNENLPA